MDKHPNKENVRPPHPNILPKYFIKPQKQNPKNTKSPLFSHPLGRAERHTFKDQQHHHHLSFQSPPKKTRKASLGNPHSTAVLARTKKTSDKQKKGSVQLVDPHVRTLNKLKPFQTYNNSNNNNNHNQCAKKIPKNNQYLFLQERKSVDLTIKHMNKHKIKSQDTASMGKLWNQHKSTFVHSNNNKSNENTFRQDAYYDSSRLPYMQQCKFDEEDSQSLVGLSHEVIKLVQQINHLKKKHEVLEDENTQLKVLVEKMCSASEQSKSYKEISRCLKVLKQITQQQEIRIESLINYESAKY